MLAVPGGANLPVDDENWGYEIKWDGVRLLCFYDGRSLTRRTRSGTDTTHRYPELHGLARALGGRRAVLDGEVVALGPDGRPSFHALQGRMHLSRTRSLPARMRAAPVTLMVFDVLHLDGASTVHLPYTQRRAVLESLNLEDEGWQTPPASFGGGADMLAAAREMALEGIVAKRLDSPYRPGERSPDWIKIKTTLRQEFVIGGWLPFAGDRAAVGSLLLGYWEGSGSARTLRYAGKVGTGFDGPARRALAAGLAALAVPASPFDERVEPGAVHARPCLVAEVEFAEWTPAARVRHARYRGLREDKPAGAVVRET
jgi:bifunctional non-homologous end joining protein LigD